MSMRSLRNWVLRSTRQRADRHPSDGVALMVSTELRQAFGEKAQELTSELRLAAAIEGAWIIERSPAGRDGEIEPNIYVTCPTLRGTFKFSPEESERRIRLAFPELGDKAVKASIRHLADRVVATLTNKTTPMPSPGWAGCTAGPTTAKNRSDFNPRKPHRMKTEITKTVKTDRHVVKLLSPIGVENSIRKPGSFVQCSPLEAADLIGRKRAVAATEAEVADNAAAIIVAPVRAAVKEWIGV